MDAFGGDANESWRTRTGYDRERYGLHKDVDVDFIDEGNGVRIVKRSDGAKRIARLRGTIKLKHAASVDEYIEDIRGR